MKSSLEIESFLSTLSKKLENQESSLMKIGEMELQESTFEPIQVTFWRSSRLDKLGRPPGYGPRVVHIPQEAVIGSNILPDLIDILSLGETRSILLPREWRYLRKYMRGLEMQGLLTDMLILQPPMVLISDVGVDSF